MEDKRYLCIDLKSFYASVECVERGLDPMTTDLVVADPERTEKTICLALSPSMRARGLPGRCRVFQIPSGISYIMAPPRMRLYIEYSARIYGICLKYVSKEDIHPYSIDECFLDVTPYLSLYGMDAKTLGNTIMNDVFSATGITATCGIGTNLYLAKAALDILSKHAKDRIAYLDEARYRELLWDHRPLTDFWRVGAGIARRLESAGIFTMRDIAAADEDLLYSMLGVDAEILIDRANGKEPVTIADIKAFRPKNTSVTSGQVLPEPYTVEKSRLILKEMVDLLSLELVEKRVVAGRISLMIGYEGEGRRDIVSAGKTLMAPTDSERVLRREMLDLFDRTVNKSKLVRRFYIGFEHLQDELWKQADLFSDPVREEKERRLRKAELEIRRKFGNNAILKGMNLEEGATAMERNRQIGGHRAGSSESSRLESGEDLS